MRFVIIFLVSLFFVNAFAQESPMPDGVSPVGEPENLPPMLQQHSAQPSDKIMPLEKKTESVKSTPLAKVDESKVYLDFRDTDMKEVARIFSKISGVSILVSENVKARVTLNIEGVTWEKALELILKTYGLASIKKDNFLIIVTYKEVQDEQDQVPLTTKIISLNFASPDDTKTYVKTIMTKRGTIESDKKTNTLIITDTPETLERVTKVITELDKKTPQVLVEVWMIDKSLLDEWDFGIDWEIANANSPDFSGSTPMEAYTYPSAAIQNIAPAAATDFSLSYGKSLFDGFRIGATLKALQNDTNSKVLANPRILTLDNVPAEIVITDQVPYTNVENSTQSSNAITSTQFKDVTTKLAVKPHITPDNNVIMELVTEQAFVSAFITDSQGNEQPQLATRKTTNTMIIKNMETVVLGGLRARTSQKVTKKIPVLGDMPLLGKLLFQSQSDSDTIRELIVFVTPSIVRDESLKMEEREDGSLKETKILLTPKTNKSVEPVLQKLDPQTEYKQKTFSDWLPKIGKNEQLKTAAATSSALPSTQTKEPVEEKKKVAVKTNITASTPKLEKEALKKPLKEEVAPNFRSLQLLPLKTPNEAL